VAKILVADDNSNIQKMVGLALKDQGIDVVAVGNGEAAVRKISDIRPDLVLADVFMPVRNGYEVCRYVKDDSTLSHIPVILLVGAFDPLDEQEAQRVGADGVLKKPFVPPDPLISMVKSALSRAGVSIGNEPAHADKAHEPAMVPMAKETLASKVPAARPAPVPEAKVEPVLEDFPVPSQAPSVKIAAGTEPVAFGSLLETPQAEEELGYVSKPSEALEAARKWDSGAETEEEEEEEGGWRPGGLEGSMEDADLPGSGQKDWREEAFHGSAPANISKSHRWTPAENTQLAEVAEAPPVAVSTLETKPSSAPAPFAGDAWAAAMATSVEETVIGTTLPQDAPATAQAVEELHPAIVESPASASSERSHWTAPAESPWEVEAKKASMFASTWDAPPTEPPSAAPSNVAEAEDFLAEEPAANLPEAASETVTEYSAQASSQGAAEFVEEAKSDAADSFVNGSPYSSAELLAGNETETQEIPVYSENTSSYASVPSTEEVAQQATEPPHAAAEHLDSSSETLVEPAPAVAAPQPNMDELVARVLAKMNPDILQKVTQEILKPVIEALIKDELNSKR
jgi:CheY-like chemotaxis protein